MKYLYTFLIFVFLTGCEDNFQNNKPLDEFYDLKGTEKLELETNRFTIFLEEKEEKTVNLFQLFKTKTVDSSGNVKSYNKELFSFYVNDELFTNEELTLKEGVVYEVFSKIGELQSDPIVLRLLNPKFVSLVSTLNGKYSLQITYSERKPIEIENTLTYRDAPIVLPNPFKIALGLDRVEEEDLPERLAQLQPGDYSLKVELSGMQSQVIPLTVTSPYREVKLEAEFTDLSPKGVFVANGRSTCNLTIVTESDIEGVDVQLTDDIELLVNGEPVEFIGNQHAIIAKRKQEFVVQVKGFGVESNVVTFASEYPDEFPFVRIPVVFHYINSTAGIPTQAEIESTLSGATDIFRSDRSGWLSGQRSSSAVDNFIEFYPATHNPDGSELPVAGLHIVEDDFLPESINAENEGEALTLYWRHYWDPTKYYNVFLINEPARNFAGWATYPVITDNLPGIPQSQTDELYYLYCSWFNNHIYPELLAHEAGHSLALYHTFYSGDECGSDYDDDYCADTPGYNYDIFEAEGGLSLGERKTCFGRIFTSLNVMDYGPSEDNTITADQRQRVRTVIESCNFLPTPRNNFDAPNARRKSWKGKLDKELTKSLIVH